MADTPKHSVSVAGIVVDDQDRVLVIQRRDNGHWEPPGGVLELDETPEDGVVREVFEETGVRVQVLRLTGVYKNVVKGVVALVYRCSLIEGQPAPTDEASSVSWRPIEDIALDMDEAYAIRVYDAFSEAPHSRTHNGVHLIAQ